MIGAPAHSPAALRNRDAILAVLRHKLPRHGTVLEVASGTGEHVVHFAASLHGLIFQPSDPDAGRRATIDARAALSDLAHIRPALDLDTTEPDWPIEVADAVLCSNMIHIAPWSAALGLIAGSARILPPGAGLFLYGPFSRSGRHEAASNAVFDASLRSRNPEWGVRDLDDLTLCAAKAGFNAPEVIAMPANNHIVVFRRP